MLSIIFGFILSLIRFCYKSKCKKCDCCFGLFKIERDINLELKYDMEI